MRLSWQVKQSNGMKFPVPFCEKAKEALEDYHVNQIITSGKLAGTTKVRSLKENNLYFSGCKTFREKMMPDPRWQYASVDMWFRYHCNHIDQRRAMVMPDGVVHFPVLPLNFAGCKQALANGYYNNALDAQSCFLGVDKDAWVEEIKRNMGGR